MRYNDREEQLSMLARDLMTSGPDYYDDDDDDDGDDEYAGFDLDDDDDWND